MDTSSRCQAYFGRAQTIQAINPTHSLAGRGAQLTTFECLATSTFGACFLPLIDTIPSGTRMIVANHPDSVVNLSVSNGGSGFPQVFTLAAGELAEIYLVGPEPVGFGLDPSHFGPGMHTLWTDFGFWWWDISTFTRFDALG